VRARISPARTLGGIDAYATAWAHMHGQACRATRVTGEQSEELLDLRMTCLDSRLRELTALLSLLGEAKGDAKLVETASGAVAKLPLVSDCADVTALTTRIRPRPEQVAALSALAVRRAQVQALLFAARYKEGLEPTVELVRDARALGYAPLTAQALLLHGKLLRRNDDLDGAETALQDSIRAAGAGGDDTTLISALVELGRLRADDRSDYTSAWTLVIAAEAAVARIGDNGLSRALVHNLRGDLAFYRDRYADAIGEYRTSLDIYRRVRGEKHVDVVRVMNDLASATRRAGRPLEAKELYLQSLDIQIAVDGEEHRNTAAVLNNIGTAAMEGGDYAGALEYYRRSLAIKEKVMGPENSGVTSTLQNVGNVLVEQGKLDEAEAAYRRALAIREKVMPDNVWTANTLDALGRIRLLQGKPGEALPFHERATAIIRKAVGEEHHEMATNLAHIGNAKAAEKRYGEAIELQGKALAMRRKLLGAEHPDVIRVLGELGETWRAQGRCDRAADLVDEGLALAGKTFIPDHPDLVPLLRTAAACRLATGHRDEALALAERGVKIAGAEHTKLAGPAVDELRQTLERAR
jgi:eukaryotic-like serine/threonine-protein kinase